MSAVPVYSRARTLYSKHGASRFAHAGGLHWRLIVGLLCVALVILAGTLSVTHGHENASVAHADCGLCATAHVALQLATALSLIPIAQVFARVSSALPPDRSRTLSRFALFTRPPPVEVVLLS